MEPLLRFPQEKMPNAARQPMHAKFSNEYFICFGFTFVLNNPTKVQYVISYVMDEYKPPSQM